MRCDRFDKYEMGKINPREFKSHLDNCPVCQKRLEADDRLMALVRSIKEPVSAPHLWSRIEVSLREERDKTAETQGSFLRFFRRLPRVAVPVAAFILAGFVLVIAVWVLPRSSGSNLLGQRALDRVEKREAQYLEAITNLENVALSKMANLDLELMLLYRDKLETIDEQIERCREAISENPANAHIRRYMLLAFQDKRETLKEILELKPDFER